MDSLEKLEFDKEQIYQEIKRIETLIQVVKVARDNLEFNSQTKVDTDRFIAEQEKAKEWNEEILQGLNESIDFVRI